MLAVGEAANLARSQEAMFMHIKFVHISSASLVRVIASCTLDYCDFVFRLN